ncbi:MAG TPA: hypothetical protein DEB73_02935 [Candidatus Magasanikbacteria bacterium]|uniref:N-acetylglucosaminyldiphosphoundecaprenol N-acetyl-beta-D-mannosaminyltransferase n=1 Tax=Candidatus Magasanikbacteria bacterium GW2011_GWC2_41_17 TaxID=1619048 RepID=A0A0G0VB78_9BACT|nr:MAG: N-acetylglucosaminyldiphosphoundecaprenol N-acetyl-beta-D-mannosaminyltransferase [Candidatus Magasanikbacteria bacterium GW2011_GWC2_41_17]HBV58188.1 hypothetical protein [Candidatus Magasanikbacteria bacterium]HBX16124.1 hypothetical protein [Candidatus Magasanikbacteria bacterium]
MIILGIKIDNLAKSEILAKISEFLCFGAGHLIVTPNPEMLVDAEYDWFFKQALNKANLSVADGFGLALAGQYLYGKKLTRWAGTDLMEKICEIAAGQGKSVYLIGGKEGIAEKAVEKLQEKYYGLKVVGAEKGIVFQCDPEKSDGFLKNEYLVCQGFDTDENNKLLEHIRVAAPDILFVAFGHGKQEKWLAEFLSRLPSVKIGMGVGGAFDYISGQVRRAPKLARYLGLEWLWRLLSQPWRIKRIWKAIVSFGLLVKDYKIQISLPFRQGVIGFIMNKEGKFFIAKRCPLPTDSYFFNIDHWQPPQGGISVGETAEQAVLKEVWEETGMTAEILARCVAIHQYDWSVAYMRKKGKGYRFMGQQKTIFLLKYNGDGSDIKVDNIELCDYRWVDLEELKKMIHPMRRSSLEILLAEVNNFRVV